MVLIFFKLSDICTWTFIEIFQVQTMFLQEMLPVHRHKEIILPEATTLIIQSYASDNTPSNQPLAEKHPSQVKREPKLQKSEVSITHSQGTSADWYAMRKSPISSQGSIQWSNLQEQQQVLPGTESGMVEFNSKWDYKMAEVINFNATLSIISAKSLFQNQGRWWIVSTTLQINVEKFCTELY